MFFSSVSVARATKFGILAIVIAAVYVTTGTAQATPIRDITITADGTSKLVVECEYLQVTATGGVVDGESPACSGARSLTISGISPVVAPHSHDDPSLAASDHEHAPNEPVRVDIVGDFVIAGPVEISGAIVYVTGSVTAESIRITGEGGVKIDSSGSLTTTGSDIELDGSASGVIVEPGAVVDAGGGSITVDGAMNLIEGNLVSNGGSVTVLGAEQGFTWLGGAIDTSVSDFGIGGPVVIARGGVVIAEGAAVQSWGSGGGGDVFIGGGPRGQGPTPTSSSVTIKSGAVITAGATIDGDGGQVVVWADQTTAFDGSISSRGGSEGGNGGDVEISSKVSLQQAGAIDTRAAKGEDGEILIDPVYYVVLPFPEPFLTGIDDLDHVAFKSNLTVDAIDYVSDLICALFCDESEPTPPELETLSVPYYAGNTIIGALKTFAGLKRTSWDPDHYVESASTPGLIVPSDHPDAKKPPKFLKKYKWFFRVAQARALFSFVSQQTLEAYTGDVKVQSVFGVSLSHGLYDNDEVLDFTQQGPGESVLFETPRSIQANGDIEVGGADLTLHAGRDAEFDPDLVLEIMDLIAPSPGMDFPEIIADMMIDSFVTDLSAVDIVGFLNLMICDGEEEIPIVVGQSADVYLDTPENFHLIDDILLSLGAPVPQWFSDVIDGIGTYTPYIPNSQDALDYVLGGFTLPVGIPGVVTTLCLTGESGSFGIPDTYPGSSEEECWVVPPSTTVPGVVTTGCSDWTEFYSYGECWDSLVYAGPTYADCGSTEVYEDGKCWDYPPSWSPLGWMWDGACYNVGYDGSGQWYDGTCYDSIINWGENDVWWLCGSGSVRISGDKYSSGSCYWANEGESSVVDYCNGGAGTWFRGDCYTVAPSLGEFVEKCYSVPPFDGVWQDGQCWTAPPDSHVPGLCEIDSSIPCSSSELAEEFFLPELASGLANYVFEETGLDYEVFSALFEIPDWIQIPDFDISADVESHLQVRTVRNPDGAIHLINDGPGDVLLAESVYGDSVTIRTGDEVLSEEWVDLPLMVYQYIDVDRSPTSTGGINTNSLTLEAGGSVGRPSNPIDLDHPGTSIDLNVESGGTFGANFESGGSLNLAGSSSVTGAGGIGISVGGDLNVPSGVSFDASELGGDIALTVGLNGPGSLTFRGSASAATVSLSGGGSDDNIELDSTLSSGKPVAVKGGAGRDTLTIAPAGAVSHGTGPERQLVAPGQQPFTLFGLESIIGVNPLIDPIGDQATGEGSAFELPYQFIDWGADEWEVRLTDLATNTVVSTDTVTGAPDGTGPFPMRTLPYVFADNGVFALRLCIEDLADGGTSCRDFTATVGNVDPTFDPIPDSELGEGELLQIGPINFNDLGTLDTHAVTFDWDDGTSSSGIVTQSPFGPPGSVLGQNGTLEADHVYGDNGVYHPTVTLTDDDGGTAAYTWTVTVNNFKPIVEAGRDATVTEGDVFSLAPSTFSDLGTLDTHIAVIDWGDGSPVNFGVVAQTPFGPPGSTSGQNGTIAGSHVYADDGAYTVTVTVTDDEGASASDTLEVTVGNAVPVVSAGPDRTVAEGSLISLVLTEFADAGTLDTHVAVIDWGDGTTAVTGSVSEVPYGPPGSAHGLTGTVDASHVYADNGVYHPTITVTDDDGGVGVASFTVTVTNVAPVIVPSGAHEVIIFDPYDINSSFSDAGFDCSPCNSLEDFTAVIDWGDGTVEAAAVTETPGGVGVATTGTVTGTHGYTWIGTYSIVVTVTDDDGGAASFAREVEVLGGRSLKLSAIGDLEPFVGEDRKIRDAISALNKAVDERYWADEVHPDSRHGSRVFTYEKQAAVKLMDLLQPGRDGDDDDEDDDWRGSSRWLPLWQPTPEPSISDEAVDAINNALLAMLTADQIVAQIAIDEAEAVGPNRWWLQRSYERFLERAHDQMSQARTDWDAGEYTRAIDHFRRAWENAESAESIATGRDRWRPGDDDD